MTIRGKLLDFKRRLSSRKMYSIVIVVISAVAIWGFYQYRHAASLQQKLDNQYNRAFYEMVAYVNNIDTLLIKSLITSTPTKTASIMQEAWRQSNLAETNLGQMPVSQNLVANTAKFLNQVGDFAYSLNNQNLSGKNLNEDQYKMIEQLHGYAVDLSNNLNEFQESLSSGRLKWGELAKTGGTLFQKTSESLPQNQFENIDKTFQDYPTLIYDGPFSDHLTTAEPRGVKGEEIDREEGKKRITAFLGEDKVDSISDSGENNSGPINTFSYKVTFKNKPEDQSAIIDVTKKGGYIFWMLYTRPISEETINIDKAKELGRKFLESRGIKNMVDTYYLKEDSTAVINYAYKQDNVVVYPDLIKVKISLDDGEIVGYEAKGYLASHIKRDIPKPKITEQQARSAISSKLKILSSGLALIPTDYKTEIFTYEFKGKLNDKEFLVYINAETGKEENILIIIDTPNGVLTM